MSSLKKHLVLVGILSALCTSSLVPVCVYADTAEAVQITENAENTQVFTIDKAIAYAKENSKTLASYKASEKYQKYYEDESRLTFKNTKKSINSSMMGASDISTILVVNGYVYRAAKMSYRVAQRNTLLQEYTLECNVSQAFYGYLSNVNKEKYAQESYALAQDNVNYAQIKYDGGMISENDLLKFQIEELNAKNTLEQATRDKEYSMMNLKTVLNYPLDKELVVTGEFTRRVKSDVTYEEAVSKAKNSITRANIEDTYALAQEKCKRYQTYYSPNQAAYHSATAEFANAELSYQSSIEQQTLNIYSAYDSMLTAYESLESLDKSLAYTENLVSAAKISYNLGTMTLNDYVSTVQAYNQIKNSIADAELGAYMATVNYEMTFDCENTIFEEDDPLL